MFERIDNVPENVIAMRAVGKITDTDYKDVLVPAIEAQIQMVGKVRLVYVLGSAFDSFTAHAAMDDAMLGMHHWKDFKKVAVVTNCDWIQKAVRIFLPLFPARTKLFQENQLANAIDWAAI